MTSGPGTGQRRREAALLFAVMALAWASSLSGAFQFDDFAVIVDEPAVQSLGAWWASMPGMRPLLKLSYALNHATGWGLAGFHAVNLAVHATCTALLWSLLLAWLPKAGLEQPRAAQLAWIAAMIFALHPVQTEAVTYLSGRSMSLMVLFSLAALRLGLASRNAGRWPDASAWGAAACVGAALAVRETAWVTVPALALLAAAGGEPLSAAWRRVAPSALVLGCAAAAIVALPAYRELLWNAVSRRETASLLATQADAIGYLLTRPLLLLETNVDPDLRPSTALSPQALPGLFMIGLLLAGAAWQWRLRPWLSVALAWPILLLVPGYSVLARADVANDRHLYLAIMGPALLAGAALLTLWRPVRSGAVALLAVTLGLVTIARNADYSSETALWLATVATSPDKPRAWTNLGYARMVEGDLPGARSALQKALALDPAYAKARYNLAEVESRIAAGH